MDKTYPAGEYAQTVLVYVCFREWPEVKISSPRAWQKFPVDKCNNESFRVVLVLFAGSIDHNWQFMIGKIF